MLKYNNKMEKFVIESTARILSISESKILRPDSGRLEQEKEVALKINDPKSRCELLEELTKILGMLVNGTLKGIVTRVHIKNIIRMIKMIPNDTKIFVEDDGCPATDFFKTECGAAALKRLSLYGNTCISYHDSEIFGVKNIAEELKKQKFTNTSVEVHKLLRVDMEEIMEKKIFMNKKTWVYTPMLPIVILRAEEK